LAALLKSQLGINAELIKSSGGVFEVTVGNELIYSKKATGEFPDEHQLVKKLVTGQGRDTL
jgi:selT/selW/selH-like putative selenoprotein